MIVVQSPIGPLEIQTTEQGISSVQKCDARGALDKAKTKYERQCVQALDEYFAGKRINFSDIPLEAKGTEFQRAVWNATQKIPAGQTVTYGEIAKRVGRPKAARAVGNALNKNPLLILVPCHRILPASGDNKFRCGGFALGSKTKRWLLEHELMN